MFDVLDDTIAAVSSPPGYGLRGIVRVSGPQAIAIAAVMFSDDEAGPLAERRGSCRYPGQIHLEPHATVPGELYLFRAPRSYTRQDVVEFHTLSSPPVLAMLLERIYEQGARGAEPGEFTARAFFNGALSLDEAESVGALIRARSDAQLRSAHALRNHAPARTAQVWSEQLAEVVALVEADIDFAEEPIEFITPGELIARLNTLRAELDALLCSADSVERFEVLPTVLLVGPANAGKSSLMNALSGVERAICSAVEGTTRDVLTAPLALPAMDCLLADGAGLNRTDDELLLLAQSMTRETAARVDLLCLVLDISREVPGDVFEILRHHPEKRAVIAANKTDLLGADVVGARIKRMVATASFPVIGTSAISGTGTTELRRAIQAQLGEDRGGAEDRSILLGTRQRNALRAASDALDRAITHSRAIDSTIERADLIAFDLREALEALAAVCGQVSTEDLLTQVFSRFCIGK